MNQLKEDLTKARAILAKGWCQRSYAKDKEGNGLTWSSREAASYCVMGAIAATVGQRAIAATVGQRGSERFMEARRAVRAEMPSDFYGSLMEYNDARGRTKEQMLRLFDKAIAKLDAQA